MPIERQRASAICLHKGKLLLIQLEDEVSGQRFWVPPGGKVEVGESPLAAAQREALEETGYEIEVNPHRQLTRTYPFVWQGRDYLTTTTYVMAHLKDPEKALTENSDREGYILKSRWWSVNEALPLLMVHPEIGQAIKDLLGLLNET